MSVRRSFLTNVKGKDFGEKHYKHCKVVLQSKKLTVCKTNASEVRDPLVVRGSSHASVDLSERVLTSLNSQKLWRSFGESQVSGKSTKSPSRCSMAVDTSAPKGLLKLKKARLDLSENQEEEDSGRWESEMTQERELATDYDDSMLDKTNDPDAEFESMIHEKTAEGGGSSFMEVDLIPIPGPPGSFLPSPWDMETDATENHVNSSVITSQAQSYHDLTDRNSSESPVSAFSNFAAPEPISLHNIITTDKSPCQRKANVFEDTTFFWRPAPHMITQDFDLLSKSVRLKTPSVSNPVLRLMGKDLMVINQSICMS